MHCNTCICISADGSFEAASDTKNLGFLHSYRYTDRALRADEIIVLYNSYVSI